MLKKPCISKLTLKIIGKFACFSAPKRVFQQPVNLAVLHLSHRFIFLGGVLFLPMLITRLNLEIRRAFVQRKLHGKSAQSETRGTDERS